MDKHKVKVLILANVEVEFETEAASIEEARKEVLAGNGVAILQEIDWESADIQQVLVNEEWTNVEEVLDN